MELLLVKSTDRSKEGSKFLDKEYNRLKELMKYEQKWYQEGKNYIAGIDEAGRGPLAGPVVSAAVILPKNMIIEGVNDSKKLSEKTRERLYDIIINKAITWSVGIVDNNIIDEINILNSAKLSMKQAVSELNIKPELLLIDAEGLKDIDIEQESIVKGDAQSHSIAAASIIAKVTRDRIICEYDILYPEYGFSRHKGYGTAEHIKAIKEHGLCPIHRRTFTRKLV